MGHVDDGNETQPAIWLAGVSLTPEFHFLHRFKFACDGLLCRPPARPPIPRPVLPFSFHWFGVGRGQGVASPQQSPRFTLPLFWLLEPDRPFWRILPCCRGPTPLPLLILCTFVGCADEPTMAVAFPIDLTNYMNVSRALA